MEKEAEEIAERRHLSFHDFALAAIEERVRRERVSWLTKTLGFVTAPILTAVLVAAFLGLISIPTNVLSPLFHWARVFAQSLLPWPLTIIIVAFLVFRAPTTFVALLGILRLFRKVSFLGAEIELTQETRQRIQAAADEIAGALKEYGERTDRAVSTLVTRHQLDGALTRFLDAAVFPTFGRPQSFRCTIHVPHPILDGYLYQLLDYQPDGAGAFRGFPERYGIIGKVWRSEQASIVGNVLGEGFTGKSLEDEIALIMANWGMTRREAERARKKPSYICFPLVYDGAKLGVVYMDAETRVRFGSSSQARRRPGR